VKLTTNFHLMPMSRMVELYLHSPTHLHGVVVNCLSKHGEDSQFNPSGLDHCIVV
jgi:hypothetical protein